MRRNGNQVRERRLALRLSQTELGRMGGYSHRAISMLELGQWRDPRMSVAIKLARALQCKVEDVFQSDWDPIMTGMASPLHGTGHFTSRLNLESVG